MILALEDVPIPALLRTLEPLPQLQHALLKLLRLEKLVRERDKVEVEEGVDRAGFEAGGLRESVPEPV